MAKSIASTFDVNSTICIMINCKATAIYHIIFLPYKSPSLGKNGSVRVQPEKKTVMIAAIFQVG